MEKRTIEECKVKRTFVYRRSDLVLFQVDGEFIICSRDHGFYTNTGSIIKADKWGDKSEVLIYGTGNAIAPASISMDKGMLFVTDNEAEVYTLTVERCHNYYVSRSGLLSSNQLKDPGEFTPMPGD